MKHSLSPLLVELEQLGQRTGANLSKNELFPAWFLLATSTDSELSAVGSLTAPGNEGGVDAVLLDKDNDTVTLVQGKLRQKAMANGESPEKLIQFFRWAEILLDSSAADFKAEIRTLAAKAQADLTEARNFLKGHNRRLVMHYATTGRFSAPLRSKYENRAYGLSNRYGTKVVFRLVDGLQVLRLLDEWLVCAAPPVDEVELPIDSRMPPLEVALDTGISSYVTVVKGNELAVIGNRHGRRIFAKNIRGYLGANNDVSKSMLATLDDHPERFWLLNNGVTIVCSEAHPPVASRKSFLLRHPQIINGQQTTRTLGESGRRSSLATVLVRIIAVEDNPRTEHREHEGMISEIVVATNHQNAIRPSDLVVNDPKQVELERSLRLFGYRYLRKRESKRERSSKLGRGERILTMAELAAAMGGCIEPTLPLRAGKEKLFQTENYSRIFAETNARTMLAMVHLNREIEYMARRGRAQLRSNASSPSTEWNRARWIVLYYAWDVMFGPVKRRREEFRRLCESKENDRDARHTLRSGLAEIFASVESFYNATRLPDDEPNKFFKRKTVYRDWLAWAKRKSRSRLREFDRTVKAVLHELEAEA